ncbi:hypothetical protein CI102_409 [Trichoderma harzianum]|nr:hypothetical protein CI102_409 [Trichoderma harzianum]
MQGRERCHAVVPSYKGAICLRQTKSLQPLKTLPVPETRSQIKINSTTCCLFLLHNSPSPKFPQSTRWLPSAPCYELFFPQGTSRCRQSSWLSSCQFLSCNSGQTHCRRLIPTLLRSLLVGHWSAFGFPSSCTLDHARKYLQQPAYCGGWLARLLTVNTERSLCTEASILCTLLLFGGAQTSVKYALASLVALVVSQCRIIEPELCKRLLPLIWLYNV